jgi:MoxR-like ATPase
MAKAKAPSTQKTTTDQKVEIDFDEVFMQLATKTLPKNKTFNPKGDMTVADLVKSIQEFSKRTARQGEKADLVSEIFHTLHTNGTLSIVGTHGIGKSAMINFIYDALNEIMGGEIVLFYIGPNRSIDQTILPVAFFTTNEDGQQEIVTKIGKARELCEGKYVIVQIEEFARLTPLLQNTALEIVSQHCVAGEHIPVLGSFILDNSGKEYQLMSATNPLMADRCNTMTVTSASTPWPYFVASTLPDEDLTNYFSAYWSLSESVREVVTGRFMERLLWVSKVKGWDPFLALPRRAGEQVRIRERAVGADGREGKLGTDVTEDVLKKLVSSLGVVTRKPDFTEVFDAVVNDGKSMIIEGPPGGGKTSYCKARLTELGFAAEDVLVVSGTTLNPDLLSTTIVAGGSLHTTLGEWFQAPAVGAKGKVLVIDDIWLMSPHVKPCVMEVTQERSIAGQKIRDLHSIVAISNAQDAFGEKIPGMSKPDLAQADRFTVSISISYDDIPFDEFLIKTYGEIGSLCVDWWKTHLNDDIRQLVSPRALERIIQRSSHGMVLERALVHRDIDGKKKPLEVDLHQLRMLLANRQPTSLKHILANVEEYLTKMTDPNEPSRQAHLEVADVFENAALSELRAASADVARLLKALNRDFKFALITRDKDERKQFFIKLLTGKADQAPA